MASINWMKARTAEEVKALLRHDERERREATHEHSNFHIDKSKTYLNYSIIGRTYKERCDMYDKALTEALAVAEANTEEYVIKKGKNAGQTRKRKKGKLRKDAVTALNLYVPVPFGLPAEEYVRWFKRVYDILVEFFGEENVVDGDVHFDEIHEYFNTFIKEWVLSRVHMHTTVIPRTEDGRLCCNEIFTRKNCIKLNNLVEEMTQREFGVAFNTGEEPHRETVEALKSKSFKEETKLYNELLHNVTTLCLEVTEGEKILNDVNGQITEANATIAELKQTQTKAEQDTAAALTKKKEAEDELEEVKDNVAAINEQAKTASHNLNVLCYQLGYGEDELKKVNEEKAKAEGELKEKKNEVTEIETKISELQQTKAKAEEETADALDMQQAVKDDLNLLIKQVTSLNSKKFTLTKECAQLENKRDILTQSVTSAERVNIANEQAENLNANAERYNSARDLYKG
ncbi:MAG: plasmid recombination protein [Muribaculaceae bacterium]|nr:plasmid recombination protein [Muribaculaceae bacterium]